MANMKTTVIGRRAKTGAIGTPVELSPAGLKVNETYAGTVWVFRVGLPGTTCFGWINPVTGDRSPKNGEYGSIMMQAKRYHPRALVKYNEDYDLDWAHKLGISLTKVRETPPKALKGPAKAKKAGSFIPIPPEHGDEAISELLALLKGTSDPIAKRKYRRALRARGHRGGLNGGPGAPRSAPRHGKGG